MVNYIWGVMIILGIIYGVVFGDIEKVNNQIIYSAKEAIELAISMLGIVAFWNGLMEIGKASGLIGRMTKRIMPIIDFLYPGIPTGHKVKEEIATNMISNILGLGWEATSSGIKSMKYLQELNSRKAIASNNMCTFLVINISSLQLIPIVVFYIVIDGIANKVKIYDEFVKGAKEGMGIVFKIAPALIGLIVAVGITRASGLLDFIVSIIEPLGNLCKIPSDIIPIAFIRLFSTSAANGLLIDIYKTYGPDSYLGVLASVVMSCTEAAFYTMSVYFSAVKVSKTRWTLAGALVAIIAGLIASIVIVGLI